MKVRTKLLPYQADVLRNPIKYLAVLGGLGCGKTRAIALIIYTYARRYPGARILLAAQTYKLLHQGSFFELKKFLREIQVDYEFNQGSGVLTFPNGSTVTLQTLGVDPDEVRGPEWSLIVIDEAAQVAQEMWQAISDRARYKLHKGETGELAPNLVRVFTNSKDVNPSHWIMKEFILGKSPVHQLLTISTYVNRKNLPPDYIPKLEKRYPPGSDDHRRWLLGEIVSAEGAVYPQFGELHIIDRDPEFLQYPASSIDFGTRDPTVILGGGMDRLGNIYVLNEFVASELAPSERIPYIQQLCSHGGPIFIDHDPAMQVEMAQAGLTGTYAHKDVSLGIDYVKSRFVGRTLFIHRRCKSLINELYNYAWKKGDLEKPEHKFSHGPDALRYLVVGLDYSDGMSDAAKFIGASLYDF